MPAALGVYGDVAMQDGATATGNGTEALCLRVDEGPMTALTMQVEGITVATVTFEATIDDSNWVAIQAENLNDGAEGTTATADGIYRITVLGLFKVRARISAYTSGTINVTGVLTV